jgi:hypothetical protein
MWPLTEPDCESWGRTVDIREGRARTPATAPRRVGVFRLSCQCETPREREPAGAENSARIHGATLNSNVRAHAELSEAELSASQRNWRPRHRPPTELPLLDHAQVGFFYP